jgi:putative Mn2+ efflux pump MntP
MGTLLLLALVLSLDTFRVSLGLGALKLRPLKQAQIALVFGLCDGLAPLAGMLIGQSLLRFVSGWAEYLGPAVLGLYGVYVLFLASRCSESEEGAEPGGWIVFGLPLSLSLDNLIAGTSLGMTGFPLPLSVIIIGMMSALAALLGLRMARMAATYLAFKPEFIGGVALIGIAAALAIEK